MLSRTHSFSSVFFVNVVPWCNINAARALAQIICNIVGYWHMTDSNVDKVSSAISFDVSDFHDILMAGTAFLPKHRKYIEFTSKYIRMKWGFCRQAVTVWLSPSSFVIVPLNDGLNWFSIRTHSRNAPRSISITNSVIIIYEKTI